MRPIALICATVALVAPAASGAPAPEIVCEPRVLHEEAGPISVDSPNSCTYAVAFNGAWLTVSDDPVFACSQDYPRIDVGPVWIERTNGCRYEVGVSLLA